MNTYLNINMYYLNVHVFKYVYVLIHTHRHFVFLFFLEIIMFFFSVIIHLHCVHKLFQAFDYIFISTLFLITLTFPRRPPLRAPRLPQFK